MRRPSWRSARSPPGRRLLFTAQVTGDPAAAIHQVWITYTGDGINAWMPLDLAQCVAPLPAACGTTADSSVWKGIVGTVPANLKYVVQAANGYGLVTFDDNFGAYYSLAGAGQAPTTVALGPIPASATYGDSPTITVTLTSGSSPLPAENVIVAIGGAARAGTTDANGVASVTVPLVAVPGSYRVIASFGGDTNYLPSSDSAGPIVVAKAPSSISALAVITASAAATATLTATVGGKPQPLLQEAVTFALSSTPGSPVLKTVVVNTDYLGRAPLQSTGLPAGTYALSASFAGNATYSSASAGQSLAIAQQTISFGTGVALPTTLAYGSAPVTFTVSSDSGLPVTVDLTPASSPYCRLDRTGPTYTLSVIAAPGLCTLEASAGGTTTFTDVTVTQNIAITRGDQTVVFSAPPATTVHGYGDPPFNITVTGSATGNPVTLTPSSACSTATDPSTHVTTVTIIAAGTCTIVADQAGSSYYNAAQATLTYTISPRQVTVTADAKSKFYGASRSDADLPDHQRLIGARRQLRRRADPCGRRERGQLCDRAGYAGAQRQLHADLCWREPHDHERSDHDGPRAVDDFGDRWSERDADGNGRGHGTRWRDANRYRYIHGRSNRARHICARWWYGRSDDEHACSRHALADGELRRRRCSDELPGLDERAGQRDDKQGGHHHDACFRQDVGRLWHAGHAHGNGGSRRPRHRDACRHGHVHGWDDERYRDAERRHGDVHQRFAQRRHAQLHRVLRWRHERCAVAAGCSDHRDDQRGVHAHGLHGAAALGSHGHAAQ